MFAFEENHDYLAFDEWMRTHWHDAVFYALIYFLLMIVGQRYMKNRTGYDLRYALFAWSAGLAIFSMIGASRFVPELLKTLYYGGFKKSVCDISFGYTKPTAVWVYLFLMSKVWELGDTAFVILRKKKLIVLHWWHHASTMVFTWFTYGFYPAFARWTIALNYSVHSIMYSYYAARALKITVPRLVNQCITVVQMIQLVLACGSIVGAAFITDPECLNPRIVIAYGIPMFSGFLFLFLNFFYHAYVQRDPPKPIKKAVMKTD